MKMLAFVISTIPFVISLSASPGPNNVIAMATAANFGYWRTVPVILGFVCGVAVMILSVGFGLGQLFTVYPQLHGVMRGVAIVYLLYLAWKITRSSGVEAGEVREKPMSFLQGALFQWINPKAWIVSISAVTTFTTPDEHQMIQTILIALVFIFIGFQSVSIWALFGSAVARFLKTPRALKIFNYLVAGLLVLSLVPLAGELF